MAGIMRQCAFTAHFEPLTTMAALAAGTERIGLAATVSSSYSEPYNVARQLASLDHISGGRAAWNVVTTSYPAAAANFGREKHEDHALRYRRANEFVDVLNGLWDSWDDAAFIRDRTTGIHFDQSGRHPINHEGEFFKSGDLLTCHGRRRVGRSRSAPAAPDSERSSRQEHRKSCSALIAIFQARSPITKDLKGRMAKHGRRPEELCVMTALNPFVGETDAEAQEAFAALQGRIHPDVGRAILSVDLEVDLTGLLIDEPIPAGMLPESANATTSYFAMMSDLIREQNRTVRQLYEACAASRGGMNAVVGPPATIADRMEEWFRAGATDGFMVRISHLPQGLEKFVKLVVPELQKRGLFRTDYQGATLRDHLGLDRPQLSRC